MTTTLRERAREVKTAGEAARGNFEPTGAPKKVYSFWLENTQTSKGKDLRRGLRKENFCHFWRVVAIWAPLMFLEKKIVKVLPVLGVIVAIAAVVALVTACIMSGNVLLFVGQIVGMLFAMCFGLLFLMVGIFAGVSMFADEETRVRRDDYFDGKALNWAFWTTVPISVPVFGFWKGVEYYKEKLAPHAKIVWLTVAGLAAITTLAVINGLAGSGAALVVAGVSTTVVVGACFIGFLLVGLATYIEGQRDLRKKRAAEARRKAMEDGSYYRDLEARQNVAPREPGKISNFFSGLADFVVLYSQVVRVNKWKICPIVTIDND